jgi:CRP-like cAMP-binding protein
MPSNTEPLIRKLKSIGELPDEDREALASLPVQVRSLEADEDVVREGDVPSVCCLLLDGFMHRYKVLPNGKRQILALHTPGDVPDLQSLFLRHLDHSLAASVPSTAGFIPHEALRTLMRESPTLTELLWRDTLIDAAIFREWIVAMGQRPAQSHLAHLLCEVFTRLRTVGLTQDHACSLPLTQAELGDACGLSTVHVNRTLQALRGDGLIELQSHRLTILDWARLKEVAQFDPAYLHLRQPFVPTRL